MHYKLPIFQIKTIDFPKNQLSFNPFTKIRIIQICRFIKLVVSILFTLFMSRKKMNYCNSSISSKDKPVILAIKDLSIFS